MTYLLIAAVWWGTFPAAGLLIALATWSLPYLLRGPLVICQMSRPLRWITPKLVGFEPRAFTWACFMFTWSDERTQLQPHDAYGDEFLAALDRHEAQFRRLILHEGNHGFWALVLGLGYPLLYVLGMAWAAARGGHWYRDNFWERLAVRAETK